MWRNDSPCTSISVNSQTQPETYHVGNSDMRALVCDPSSCIGLKATTHCSSRKWGLSPGASFHIVTKGPTPGFLKCHLMLSAKYMAIETGATVSHHWGLHFSLRYSGVVKTCRLAYNPSVKKKMWGVAELKEPLWFPHTKMAAVAMSCKGWRSSFWLAGHCGALGFTSFCF